MGYRQQRDLARSNTNCYTGTRTQKKGERNLSFTADSTGSRYSNAYEDEITQEPSLLKKKTQDKLDNSDQPWRRHSHWSGEQDHHAGDAFFHGLDMESWIRSGMRRFTSFCEVVLESRRCESASTTLSPGGRLGTKPWLLMQLWTAGRCNRGWRWSWKRPWKLPVWLMWL